MQEQVSRQQYVGIDLHRRRSVIVRIDDTGKVLGKKQVLNDPVEFALAMAEAGEGPEVALEATYGYYWAADLLKENGAHVHWCTLWGSIGKTEELRTMSSTRPSWPRGSGGTTSQRPGWHRQR